MSSTLAPRPTSPGALQNTRELSQERSTGMAWTRTKAPLEGQLLCAGVVEADRGVATALLELSASVEHKSSAVKRSCVVVASSRPPIAAQDKVHSHTTAVLGGSGPGCAFSVGTKGGFEQSAVMSFTEFHRHSIFPSSGGHCARETPWFPGANGWSPSMNMKSVLSPLPPPPWFQKRTSPGAAAVSAAVEATTKRKFSEHHGLSWDAARKLWKVHIFINGKRLFLGDFVDEDVAASVYDEAAFSAENKKLNFPENFARRAKLPKVNLDPCGDAAETPRGLRPEGCAILHRVPSAFAQTASSDVDITFAGSSKVGKQLEPKSFKQRAVYSSKYKGVTWNSADRKWKAQIKVKGKTVHLGLFHDEVEAARKFDEVARRLHRTCNVYTDE